MRSGFANDSGQGAKLLDAGTRRAASMTHWQQAS
jgi:hypothetical protein